MSGLGWLGRRLTIGDWNVGRGWLGCRLAIGDWNVGVGLRLL